MKLKSTLLLAGSMLLFASAAQAQNNPSKISEKSKLGQSILSKHDYNPKFRAQSANKIKKAAKTTADSFSRPIAYMNKYYDNNNWEIIDSLFITWKGDHAKDINLFNYGFFDASYMNPADEMNYYELYAEELVYNRNIDEIPLISYSYHLYNDGGLYDYEFEHHYDANEKLVKSIVNGTDSLIYGYHNNGKMNLKKGYFGTDTEIDSVVFDANGNLTDYVNISSGGNTYHYEYKYDNANKLIRKSYSNYDNTNTFQYGSIDSIFYPSNTVDSHVVYHYWSNTWNKTDIVMSTKDANGNVEQVVSFDDDGVSENFTAYINRSASGLEKYIYYLEGADTLEYYEAKMNANGDVLEMLYQDAWNNGILENQEYQVATYNEENLPLTVKHNNYYNPTTNAWELTDGDYDMVIYYEKHGVEDTSTAIAKINASQVAVYPNPTMDQLTIAIENENIQAITIYNAMGRIVRTYQIPNKPTHNINVATLAAGNYIMQVKTNKGIANTKFVKE